MNDKSLNYFLFLFSILGIGMAIFGAFIQPSLIMLIIGSIMSVVCIWSLINHFRARKHMYNLDEKQSW